MQESKNSISAPFSQYKLVFLGDQSVGKTSIINRFMFDTFDGQDHPTVGIDFISQTLYSDDKTIRLQLWDTAGQQRFRTLIPNYIRDAVVAIVVYDISNKQSFLNAPKWIQDVRNQRGTEVVLCLVGNQNDLVEQRQIQSEEAAQLAKEMDLFFTEVSAQSGYNIQHLFKTIASKLPGVENSITPNSETDTNKDAFHLNQQQPQVEEKQKSSCC